MQEQTNRGQYTINCRSLIGRSVVVPQGKSPGDLVSGFCLHALHGFCARESHGYWELKLKVLLHRSRTSCTLKLRGVFLQSVKLLPGRDRKIILFCYVWTLVWTSPARVLPLDDYEMALWCDFSYMGKNNLQKLSFFYLFCTELPSDFVPDRNISFALPAWRRMAGEVKLSEAYVKQTAGLIRVQKYDLKRHIWVEGGTKILELKI